MWVLIPFFCLNKSLFSSLLHLTQGRQKEPSHSFKSSLRNIVGYTVFHFSQLLPSTKHQNKFQPNSLPLQNEDHLFNSTSSFLSQTSPELPVMSIFLVCTSKFFQSLLINELQVHLHILKYLLQQSTTTTYHGDNICFSLRISQISLEEQMCYGITW